ncbi:hypothetical protein DL96DRAFT_1614731 [Flagelloscypha sp. PMI_526]|nr:hypothetical protein DL96DRAFT_1614731 [Flagelloscypha sp. PMI_526]
MALGAHKFTKESGAALIFFIGYVGLFLWMLYAYLTHRIKWRSRYSLLFFHITIRLGSQACGVAFGILGFDNTGVFLAYLILGVEGYFTLVLCAYRFLISWHHHNLPSKESWLEPRDTNSKKLQLFVMLFFPAAFIVYWKNFMFWIHMSLAFANAAIVTGGSYLSGADFSQPDSADTKHRMYVSKIARTAGQSVFLTCNFILLFSLVHTMRKDKRELKTKGESRIHPTLIVLLVTWFPLMVRGIFGVLQSAVWSLSYYNPDNYTATGFTDRFTAIEYCLGVVPEWLAAALLLVTYGTSKGDPRKGQTSPAKEKKEAHGSELA